MLMKEKPGAFKPRRMRETSGITFVAQFRQTSIRFILPAEQSQWNGGDEQVMLGKKQAETDPKVKRKSRRMNAALGTATIVPQSR